MDNHSQIDKLDHLYKELETDEDKQIKKLEADEQLNAEDSLAFLIETQHKKRRIHLLLLSAAALLLLAASSIAGFFYFSNKLGSPEEKIKLEITGPQKAKIKEEVTYKITIRNEGKVETVNNKINILKPDGFWITKTVPEKNNHLWNLETLAPFASKTLEVSGYFIDEITAAKNLKVTLTFSPQNFSSTFTISEDYQVALAPFEAEFNPTMPETISPGEKAKFTFEFGNPKDSATTMEKIKIKITPTADLQILSMNPKTENNEPVWLIQTLKPGEKNKFEIEFAARNDMEVNDENREQKFLIEFLQGNNDDEFFSINTTEAKTMVANQELTTYLIINGSIHDQAINPGDTLNCSLVYKNKSKKTFNNIEARVNIMAIPAGLLDWSKLSDKQLGTLKTNGDSKEIIWTKEQVALFKEIKPGTDGIFTFSLPLKATKDLKESDKAALADGKIEINTSLNVNDASKNTLFTINGNKIIIAINSDTSLINKAVFFYDDGTPIGSGPLPPKVGEKTKYKIVWAIKNTLHDLEKITVTTVLPKNVSMTTETNKNIGDITFDEKTRQATWTIDSLTTKTLSAECSFFVELLPTLSDVGKIAKLTENTTLTATDKKTNAPISITQTTLTSNLDNDPYGKGFGAVQK